jgi:hypothetical protein
LRWTVGSDAVPRRCSREEAEELLAATVGFWRSWLSASRYRGRWREVVHRSALTLKLLTYAPTGAIVAAPTTSLPEQIGGERNWDYRYVWIRDAAFCLYALLRLGFTSEADAFIQFILGHAAASQPSAAGPMQVMYGIDGRTELPEAELRQLAGYGGSAPVRIGNAAAKQFQLDIYGELMDSVYLYDRWYRPISSAHWDAIITRADWLCDHWDQPDEGIWETRGGPKKFLYSQLMCWVAMERAVRLAIRRGLPADLERWRKTRDAIYRRIMDGGDWVIELGPGAGAYGGTVITQGTPGQLETDPRSIMGPFLAGATAVPPDRPARAGPREQTGQIAIEIGDLYNLHDLTAAFPAGRLTALAGPSGAGKTALVLDSLIPAARVLLGGSALPGHVRRLDLGGIRQVVQIDASPIGQNARSTPATYSGAFDQIRRMFAETAYARRRRWKPGHFSFNTRQGQCPTCRGLGHIDLDVQYLPDITIGCPTGHGARFNDATLAVQVDGLTIADVLGLSVHDALDRFADRAPIAAALRPVSEVGLGYLQLGEPTPSLSGGESQRLRIASRLRSSQRGALYVFDEPSTGLHSD